MLHSETRVHLPQTTRTTGRRASSETWASGTFPANVLSKSNGASFPILSENGPNRTEPNR